MAFDDNNIFARIIRGEIPCHKVFEDDATFAFMDRSPMSPGHVLVLPKTHARNIFDVTDTDLAGLIVKVGRTARAVNKAFDCDGVSIRQNNEDAGGQSVFHLHFHVLPRWAGVPLKPQTGQVEKPDVLAEQAERIRRAIV